MDSKFSSSSSKYAQNYKKRKETLLQSRKILHCKVEFKKHLKIYLRIKNQKYKENRIREINKLIFVQDFEQSLSAYIKLSLEFPNDPEIQFRLVEVAARTDKLSEIEKMCRRPEDGAKYSLVKDLTWILAQVRLYTQEESSSYFSSESSSVGNGLNSKSKDVVGLSAKVENLSARSEYKPAGLLGMSSAAKPLLLSTGSLRMTRNATYPDDFPHDGEYIKNAEVKVFNESLASQVFLKSEQGFVSRMREIYENHVDSSAVLFVQGCVDEYLGNLGAAVEHWKRAFLMNPKSINILATLAELQQIGVLSADEPDYGILFENLDRFLVHGSLQTHLTVYREFLEKKDYEAAINALKTLGDWMQKLRGEVPEEIEILILLGSMKAYATKGNMHLSEACRREAENLAVMCKKNPKNSSQLVFIAQTSEEFGMISLAKMCFFSLLTNRDTPLETVLKAAHHCLAFYVSMSLAASLKAALKIHNGDKELERYYLSSELRILQVDETIYAARKNRILEIFEKSGVNDTNLIPLLEESLKETENDADIHFISAQVFETLGFVDKALRHFQAMYEINSLHTPRVLFFLKFLNKHKYSQRVHEMTRNYQDHVSVNSEERAKIIYHLAYAHRDLHNLQMSWNELEKSLKIDPWNLDCLCLAILVHSVRQNLTLSEPVVRMLEDLSYSQFDESFPTNQILLKEFLDHGTVFLEKGHVEMAFFISKICFFFRSDQIEICQFYIRAGASLHSRISCQHTIMLIQASHHQRPFTLSFLACTIAEIYCLSKEWVLMEEWCDIAARSDDESGSSRAKLFYLGALSRIMLGKESAKSRIFLESLIDSGDTTYRSLADLQVMLGYVLLTQGELKSGLEKLRSFLSESQGLLCHYFAIKGFTRLSENHPSVQESLKKVFNYQPTNALEVFLIEEIHCTLGITNRNGVDGLVN